MYQTVGKTALSPREKQVLFYLAQSYSNKEIAKILEVTHHTIKAHVGVILRKLGAKNRLEAVMKAVQLKLVSPPPSSIQP